MAEKLPDRKVEYVRDDYSFAVSLEALRRQTEELRLRFPCCGELREVGHHSMCSRAPKLPEIHADQGSLL